MPTNNNQYQNYLILYTVHGEEGAANYPVGPGQKVLLIDSENAVIYVKSANALGQPLPMEYYDLVMRKPVMPEPAPAPMPDNINEQIDARIKEALSKYFPQINFKD